MASIKEPGDEIRTRATYREAISEPRFRVLFGARATTITADTLRTVALSMLVFDLTRSSLMAAITFGISFLPQIVGGTLFGALADRLRPRSVIVTAYAAEGTVSVALALGHLPVAADLVLVGLVACGTPIFAGASSRLVAEVLTGDTYVIGRSLWNMGASVAQILGTAVGGVASAALGPHTALLIAAGCYLISSAGVRVGFPDLLAKAPAATVSRSTIRQSWTGNRRLLADSAVRILLIAQCLPPAYLAGAESLIIPYSASRGFPAGSAGLLLACVPAGMIIGNLVVSKMIVPKTRERLTVPLIAVCGLPLIVFAAAPSAVAAGLLLAVAGGGFAYGLGVQRLFLEVTVEELRGQAFGLLQTGAMTLQGVGPLVFGALTEWLPLAQVIGVGGVMTLLTAAAVRISMGRQGLAPLRGEPG
jgi:MFS family permease